MSILYSIAAFVFGMVGILIIALGLIYTEDWEECYGPFFVAGMMLICSALCIVMAGMMT